MGWRWLDDLMEWLMGDFISGVFDFVIGVIKAVVAETAAFFVLGLVIAWLFRQKLIHAMDKGLQYIGNTLAETFIAHIVPEIKKGREAIERHFIPVIVQPAASAPPEIEERLARVREEIAKGSLISYDIAERGLLALRGEHPENFEILVLLAELYWRPGYDRKAAALEVLNLAEDVFNSKAQFYSLLATAYIRLKAEVPLAFKHAVEAVKKSIGLEPQNPGWRRMLGYVYWWFGDLDRAIGATEEALIMAGEQGDQEVIEWCKNNLAYYYAMEGKPEKRETALEYARAAYDETDSATIDTLGYVTMKYAGDKAEVKETIRLFNLALERAPRQIILDHLEEAYNKLRKTP